MNTTRLETFSDGVLAIIITIMVLELKTPHGSHLEDLLPLLPVFLTYLLSFQVIGIYWNNHHHLLHHTKEVTPAIMWANLHFLFWISLIPFATSWLGEHYTESLPTALYGVVLLSAAMSYTILQLTLMNHKTNRENLTKRLGSDMKGKLSLTIYVCSVLLAFVNPVISDLLFVLVALIWFIPDKRLAINI